MSNAKVNEDGLTFDEWTRRVDRELVALVGLSSSDLADWNSWDAWNDGVPPYEAAEEILYNDDTFMEVDWA